MKLNLRNNFVLVKNTLTKRNVESPSLEDVKNYLDQVLSGLMPFLLTPGLFSTFFWYDCDHHERYGKSEYVMAVHNRNGATSKFNRKSNSASSSGTKSKESKPLGQKIWTEKKKSLGTFIASEFSKPSTKKPWSSLSLRSLKIIGI